MMFVTMFQDGQFAGGKKEAWAQVSLQISGQTTADMREGFAQITWGTWRAGRNSHASPNATQQELDKMTIAAAFSSGRRVWRHNFLTSEMEFAHVPSIDNDYRRKFSNPCVVLQRVQVDRERRLVKEPEGTPTGKSLVTSVFRVAGLRWRAGEQTEW